MAGVTTDFPQNGPTVELTGDDVDHAAHTAPFTGAVAQEAGMERLEDAEDIWSGEVSGRIPLKDLPPLPPRSHGFFMEPLCGVCVVTVFSLMFIGIVLGTRGASDNDDSDHDRTIRDISQVPVYLVWAEAGVATLCVLYLLFGGAGVVKRSEKTCYPMPPEVERRIRQRRCLDNMPNISGPQKSSYCVRCLVWRQQSSAEKDPPHHCSVCSRCVRGFDHHCGVFGRCIVRANMPCFVTLIAMLPAGFMTAFLAIMAGGISQD
mmetsp:Transcript_68293/g.142749  ORF Transcript_68293/g.142749 Transcript_68293/m.142749 type:complete len:262 (+) Transcript_68293:117-902(+)|eukprot:CAMPEP_0206423168 /NCGR_PEP_ID=MMETSP0324_2-20121206/2529_1 /ASSEMBLY_ACC=CAM_ASM_000836 /TAXON_ID=2866 /ORGANISM="Crypthecodinium cohnii, Strain Seligo" /LENGTH=261 /DNA_ID=CAMNT_0053887695 /DNA_START=336 /DNA_END=1121 /DNA_ORIENTATION=-